VTETAEGSQRGLKNVHGFPAQHQEQHSRSCFLSYEQPLNAAKRISSTIRSGPSAKIWTNPGRQRSGRDVAGRIGTYRKTLSGARRVSTPSARRRSIRSNEHVRGRYFVYYTPWTARRIPTPPDRLSVLRFQAQPRGQTASAPERYIATGMFVIPTTRSPSPSAGRLLAAHRRDDELRQAAPG
jgi:hypothetical protein